MNAHDKIKHYLQKGAAIPVDHKTMSLFVEAVQQQAERIENLQTLRLTCEVEIERLQFKVAEIQEANGRLIELAQLQRQEIDKLRGEK